MIPSMHDFSSIYYLIGALSFISVFIRVVYGWFRDYDNAQKFAADMAKVHLPYIYNCLNRIATKLEVQLPDRPEVNFSIPGHNPS